MLALAVLLLPVVQTPAPRAAPVEVAPTELEKIEAIVRDGRYAEARTRYAKLAKDAPGTPEGIEAAERSQPSAYLGWADVVRRGPSKNRVDVVLLGDGYELEHLKAFDKLAADVPPLFDRVEPFREYAQYVNFLRAVMLSKDAGVDGFGREYDTALDGHTEATFAGHVAVDHGKVLRALAKIPDTDRLAIVFVKNGVLGTGGGGVATIGGREVKTVVHEFGHAFGWLADEYETAQSHEQGTGPVRDAANVSSTDDPAKVPWSHWLKAKHPGVGIYEGAAGRVHGAWRPTTTGCVMSDADTFCVVCREALVLRIYSIVDPIESCTPAPIRQGSKAALELGDGGLAFEVDVMRPATHPLEVSWYLLPSTSLPRSGDGASTRDDAGVAGPAERARRGPLPEIVGAPVRVVRGNESGVHRFELKRSDVEPGRWRVICRVQDTAKVRGEKWPWVLDDPLGLLASERGWWIDVPPAK
jgi:hypothetical protein